MFLNAWSLSLTLCSIIVIFLMTIAARTAFRVIRYWNPGSDSNLQIRLESETWLASTLVEYALAVQAFSLLLFLLAADNYSKVIAGAMCATGTLLANGYGMPALLFKISGFFLYAFWILTHQLDIRSESYPLVRFKFSYLLFLLPVVIIDQALQTAYIANLDPDIITSCCAVVFSDAAGEGRNLIGALSAPVLPVFYTLAAFLFILGLLLGKVLPVKTGERTAGFLLLLYTAGWAIFFLVSLLAITSVLSSYIYAMPSHRCPFDIIKPEYNYIGVLIYTALLAGTFAGVSPAFAKFVTRNTGLGDAAVKYGRTAVILSTLFLAIFICASSYHYLKYMITGGESL
ncbi:MAG: hypothetical protein KKG47_07815 [Proteobacteria bacterium]|nr:hypothetical protein [Pseudomonadota bacterium]MBU1739374.1 hypothetical protein [Pseudomonadota bacterium]